MKCPYCGYNLPLHSNKCQRNNSTFIPWTNGAVWGVLIIGLILGYILGIWTPESWLN